MNNDGNLSSIIIALIGLVTTVIVLFGGAVIYFGKWFSKHYGQDMQAHTEAAIKSASASKKLSKAVDGVVESNGELLEFMKSLNGKLAKAANQTIKEQNVIHQTVTTKETK